MQTTRILQVLVVTIVVAIAAGCATTNQYVSKLFSPKPIIVKDSQTIAIKFLELESLDADKLTWVKTDITKDNDSTMDKTVPIIAETQKIPLPEEPVAKTTNPDGTRSKKSRE